MLWALICGFAPFAVAVWLCGLLEDYTNRVSQRRQAQRFAEAMATWTDEMQPMDWVHILDGFPQKPR